jgi:outer membrane lipoprotein-sorting protein
LHAFQPQPFQQSASPPADPQAISVLKQSIIAMGGTVPQDSRASGTVLIIAGSEKEEGSFTILTRGTSQTAEQITTTSGTRKFVYFDGLANDTDNAGSSKMYSVELAASSQSPLFPLPLLTAILSYGDTVYEYIGAEDLDGVECHHVRIYRTFAAEPDLTYLASFTTRDIWIDSKTGLPHQVTYSLRDGTGAVPTTSVTISFSNYRQTGTIQYPLQIVRSINGTPWMIITISSVTLNTGLSDSNFAL